MMIEKIASKLVIFGAKKFVEAKLGAESGTDDTFALVDDVAEILNEDKNDILGVWNSYQKRMKKNNGPQTAETAAEDFMNALDAKKLQASVRECHKGEDTTQEAHTFALQCWRSMSQWRTKHLNASLESEAEKYCIAALETTFCSVVASALYQSNTGAQINRKMDTMSEKFDQLLEHKQTSATPSLPHLLTRSAPAGKCWFREDELKDIKEKLKSKQNLMLVNGFGGIGKSTVAGELFREIHEQYSFAGWVPYAGSVSKSISQHFENRPGFPWGKLEKEPERTKAIWRFLSDTTQPTLLILDNVEQDELADPELETLTELEHLTVILTSRREAIGAYDPFPIGFLNEANSVALFIRYYETTKRKFKESDRETVKKLVKLVQYHTYSIALLALSAKQEPNLSAFYAQMKEIGLKYPDLSVKMGNQKATMAEHLKKLFDWTHQSPAAIHILRNFALMPSVTIPVEVYDWIRCDKNDLSDLTETGWLMFQEEDDTHPAGYYMHPLVKEVLWLDREQFPEDIGIEFVICLLTGSYIAKGKESYVTALPKLEIADSVLKGLSGQETEVYAPACNRLASLFQDFGDYSSAQRYFELAKEIGEAVMEPEDDFLGAIYNNLAGLYKAQGNYSQAEQFYLKALAIREKTLGTDHPSTATTYHNLGSLCDAQGKADEALEWLLRALRVWLSMKHYRTEEKLLWIFKVYPRSSYAKEQENPLDWLKSRLNAEEMLGVVFALLKLLQEQE